MDVSQDFDPYLEWLGIPASEQPPDHYRLLGVSRFESDAKILRAAADQRFVYLRTFQLSPHSSLAERLLNEIAAAKICLLAPEKKAAYDAELRDASGAAVQTLEPQSSPQMLPLVLKEPPPAPPPIQSQPSPLFTIDSAAPVSSIVARVRRGKHAQNRRMARTVLLVAQIVLGGIFGLAAGCFLLSLAYPNHPVLVAVKGFFHAETTSGNGSEDRSQQPSQQGIRSRDNIGDLKTTPPRSPGLAEPDSPTGFKDQSEHDNGLSKEESGEPAPPDDTNRLPPHTVYLATLEPQEVKIFRKTRLTDPPTHAGGLKVTHGLFLHPPQPRTSSHVAFHINREFSKMSGGVGISDEMARKQASSQLVFRVIGDGRELWRSRPLRRRGAFESFSVSVRGVEKLELFVDCDGSTGWCHAVWIDPLLSR